MQTETQKNWNKHFNNKKPRKHIPPQYILAALVSLVVICAIFLNKDENKQENVVNSVYTPDTKSIISNNMVTSNKNGIIMKNSINSLFDYIQASTDELNIDILNDYVTKISSLNLSEEYNILKAQAIQKIQYLIFYRETNNTEYLDKYHSIDITYEATKAFNSASVKYELNNDKITYWYYVN